MNFSDFLGVLGVVLGIVSLVYAYYQNKEREKLEEFVRTQSWYVYSKANNMSGITQAALRAYKAAHTQSKNDEVIELLAKADAFGQDLFRETIRQIQLSEPVYSKINIDSWITDGKIEKNHAVLFEGLCVTPIRDPRSWWKFGK
jgi:hypothetical protein